MTVAKDADAREHLGGEIPLPGARKKRRLFTRKYGERVSTPGGPRKVTIKKLSPAEMKAWLAEQESGEAS